MKVRDFVKFLMDFNMDAEIVVFTSPTYCDIEDLDLSWGGPRSSDGNTKFDAEYIYIDNLTKYKSEV